MSENTESPATLTEDIGSTTGGVGATDTGRADVDIVVRASIATSDMEGKPHLLTQRIKSVYKSGDDLILLAAAPTGELVEIKVSPTSTLYIIRHSTSS